MGVKGSVDPHIQYSVHFALWEAAIEAGATLDELNKLFEGGYSPRFLAYLLAWHRLHKAVELHSEAAAMRDLNKGA